jgi:hypothetical protein
MNRLASKVTDIRKMTIIFSNEFSFHQYHLFAYFQIGSLCQLPVKPNLLSLKKVTRQQIYGMPTGSVIV